MNIRLNKINDLVRRHLDDIFLKKLSFKEGVFVTIVKIDTSADLRYTHVFISVFPDKEISYALKTLEKELYFIQGNLNKKLHMKPLPRLEFKIDLTESRADEIEKLLKKISN